VGPLRSAPEQGAEQVSQLLLGEGFRIESRDEKGEWLDVILDADGYRGWLRSWYALELDSDGAAAWHERANGRVSVLSALLVAAASTRADVVMPLPWGAKVVPVREHGRWLEVELPDGRAGFLPARSVATGAEPGGVVTPKRLIRTARFFLGVPYSWGGRSAWGFDCSGFVQAVFAWHGVQLPRDAAQQMGFVRSRAGERRRRKTPESVRAGELAFFGPAGNGATHVALGAGEGHFLHCQGEVRWSSFLESSQLFEKRLVSIFLGAWRLPSESGSGGGQKRETA
jgi:hypothetical protein